MKKLFLLPFLVFSVLLYTGCSDDDDDNNDGKEDVIISFNGKLTEANSEFTTTDGEPIPPVEYGYFKSSFKDPSNILEFSHYYSPSGLGGGFTYTNKTDITTPGYTNTSAITAKGKNGATYLTGCLTNPAQITMLKPTLYSVKGMWVTNATYAYLAIKDGNDGGGYVTKFKDGDWFKLTIIGYNAADKEIDSVDFYLADYRNGKSDVIKDWTWVDLTKIADAETIKFELTSTDNGEWGMNTPAYFCLDGITLEER